MILLWLRSGLNEIQFFQGNSQETGAEEQEITKETQQAGKVTTSVYKKYFMAVDSLPIVVAVTSLLLIAQILMSSISFFISIW